MGVKGYSAEINTTGYSTQKGYYGFFTKGEARYGCQCRNEECNSQGDPICNPLSSLDPSRFTPGQKVWYYAWNKTFVSAQEVSAKKERAPDKVAKNAVYAAKIVGTIGSAASIAGGITSSTTAIIALTDLDKLITAVDNCKKTF